jgi:hypothetical protein
VPKKPPKKNRPPNSVLAKRKRQRKKGEWRLRQMIAGRRPSFTQLYGGGLIR